MDKFKVLTEALTECGTIAISRGDANQKERLITATVDQALAVVNSGNNDTGIDIVAKQYWEQQDKHGFTVEADVEHNQNEQLAQAAVFVLTEDPDDYPDTWNKWFMDKIRGKSDDMDGTIEKLGIAGGLIVAEINRLLAIKNG